MTTKTRLVLFCAVCLTLALAVPPARAAEDAAGSIRVAAEAMTLHRVGAEDGSLTPAFSGSGADLGTWAEPETAQALADWVEDREIPGQTRQTRQGQAVFSGLEPGYYLLTQPGAGSVRPFLVPIPMTVGDRTYYDITAAPKPAGDLPDTGQRWGTGPWLAAGALALAGLMVLLRCRKGRK